VSARVCRGALGAAPPIRLIGKEADVFCYVPAHLYYMVSETLKVEASLMRKPLTQCGVAVSW
jgi:hypothetical protein